MWRILTQSRISESAVAISVYNLTGSFGVPSFIRSHTCDSLTLVPSSIISPGCDGGSSHGDHFLQYVYIYTYYVQYTVLYGSTGYPCKYVHTVRSVQSSGLTPQVDKTSASTATPHFIQ